MAEYTSAERRTVLLACCISGFITPLLSTMMNLSLVNIGDEFGVGSHAQAYVNTAFLLSSVVFMVPMARLGDILGKRKVFLAGLMTVLAGSVLAVFSPTFTFLLICRAVIGAGAAALVCTSVSMITDVFPPGRRGGAIGLQTMCVYIGLAAGPPLGGVVNDFLGWHSVFLMVVPLAIASAVLMSMFRREIAPDRGGRFDSVGTVLYAGAMVLTMGGVINLPEAWAFAMLPVGLLFLAVFVVYELKIPHHLLNMRLFRNRVFSGSCLAAFLSYAASYSISFFLALYLQKIFGLSSTEAGILMLVQPAIQAVGTPIFGRVSDRMADKRVLPTSGMLLIAAGLASMMMFGSDTSYAVIVATMAVVGVGFSLFSAPNTSVIMSSVDRTETGAASAMVSVTRQTGMMVSMGIAMLFISTIMGSADFIGPDNSEVFLDVMGYSFGVCLAMCIVGAVASLLRGGSGTAPDDGGR